MSFGDIMIIVIIAVGAIAAGLYFLNRWASKKQVDQQGLIEKTKQPAQIYVIDKRHDKASEVTLPKAVMDGMPKLSKAMKMYFVKAKVGPQIVTLMCDKNVYEHVEVKKTYKIDLAGIYIVSVKGMKSKQELKDQARVRKSKAREEKKAASSAAQK